MGYRTFVLKRRDYAKIRPVNFLLLCLTTLVQVGDVYRCVTAGVTADQSFAITAKVTCVMAAESNCGNFEFAVEDDKDAANLFFSGSTDTIPAPGDTVSAHGTILRRSDGKSFARITAFEVLAHGAAPQPRQTTVREMVEGRVDCRYCRLHATIRETAPSPYKTGLAYLTAVDDGCAISVWTRATAAEYDRLHGLIGQEVDILGFCTPVNVSELKFTGRQIRIYDPGTIRATPSGAPAAQIPSVGKIGNLRPTEIDALSLHCATGCVYATWRGQNALLKSGDGDFLQVGFLRPAAPTPGDVIEVIGFPESNFFRINLVNARWRKTGTTRLPDATPALHISPDIFKTSTDTRWSLRTVHGNLLKTTGRILSLPKPETAEPLIVRNDFATLLVETEHLGAQLSRLSLDSVIEVTGFCIIEAETWRSICPKFENATLIPRTPSDLRILSTPSWWTVGRLLYVITGLFSCLIVILIWNTALRKASLRKGHQLAREQLKRAKAQLKAEERTRLAVELHDSLAQNLTGVSLEVDSVLQRNGVLDSEANRHLTIASRALQSCCTDLRNSIWDLRNEALYIPDMNTAIRQTVGPHIGNAALKVRFNVPRKSLDENSVHAILRIIRELSSNAVRHGEATVICIAGSLDGEFLLFHVRDNGRGFDAKAALGITEGHFGLQGIRERVKDFNGQFAIDSAPGKGAKVTIRMEMTCHG